MRGTALTADPASAVQRGNYRARSAVGSRHPLCEVVNTGSQVHSWPRTTSTTALSSWAAMTVKMEGLAELPDIKAEINQDDFAAHNNVVNTPQQQQQQQQDQQAANCQWVSQLCQY